MEMISQKKRTPPAIKPTSKIGKSKKTVLLGVLKAYATTNPDIIILKARRTMLNERRFTI